VKFEHINIISRDWRKLAKFYQEVFDCAPLYPERSLTGEELSRGTGVQDARLKGIQLRLPGHSAEGPRLEIFQYSRIKSQLPPAANRLGLQHLAFRVDDVAIYQEKVVACGGQTLGEVATLSIAQIGTVKFAYVTDLDNNIIELQQRE
jgi:catechol 2,3-dioxygenase-like lactoylglutathione lyase family enzyme